MIKKLSALFFLILLMAGTLFAAEKAQIKLIQAKRDRGFDYLDIYVTGNVKGKSILLEDQLQIDFPNTKIAKDIRISKRKIWKSKRIRDIRVKQVNSKTARVIVYLKRPVDYEIVNVFGRNKSVVEICDRKDKTVWNMANWEKKYLSSKGQKLKPYKYKPLATGKDKSLKGKVIVVDPGHGGKDPGAISSRGYMEKRLTLATARKAAYLLKNAGATVYLTRNADRTNNLKDVVKFANKVGADIFISIHYNFSEKRSISGTETYYYNRRSRSLALTMHRTLINGIRRKDRGLRKARYYVVRHTNMPAILLEPVYLSNYREAELASNPKFQGELATDILRGVKSYFRSRRR